MGVVCVCVKYVCYTKYILKKRQDLFWFMYCEQTMLSGEKLFADTMLLTGYFWSDIFFFRLCIKGWRWIFVYEYRGVFNV